MTRRTLLALGLGILTASALTAGPPAKRIADINQDPDGSGSLRLVEFRGGVLVQSHHAPDPERLWWTDGTADGTRLLGPVVFYYGVDIAGIEVFSGRPSWRTPERGPTDWELWRTDGTPEGTTRVADIWPGPNRSSSPQWFVRFGERAFFTAEDPVHGRELWVTDGTAEGTQLVLDLRPGPSSSQPSGLVPCGSTLFFSADDGIHGQELWSSDGTAAGTRLVRDIVPGADGSWPGHRVTFGGALVFTADDGVHGVELWTSDGTLDGTRMVVDLLPGPESSYPSYFLRSRDAVIFSAADLEHGSELWSTDLTGAGTRLLADVAPGPESSGAWPFAVLGDVLVFLTYDPSTGWEQLWRLDPALAAPEPFGISHVTSRVTQIGDEIVYRADDGIHGPEPWRSDGTREGTRLLADVRPGPLGSDVDCHWLPVARLGNEVVTQANDGVHGCELVGIDLATGALRIAHEFAPGTAGSEGYWSDYFRDRLVFKVKVHDDNRSLWSTDGTADGSRILPLPLASAPWEFVGYDDRLLVAIGDTAPDNGLWSWDGESESAIRLGDFGDRFTSWNGEIWYRGYHPRFGSQIFRTNGTPEGTAMAFVVDRGGAQGVVDRSLGSLHPAAGVLAFTATGSRGVEPHVFMGYGVLDFDLWPGGSSYPGPYWSAPGGSVVWFSADTPGEGRELWRLDLISLWPSLVKDIFPGPGASNARIWHVWTDDRALVDAYDLDHGQELWVSDGTDQGTVLLRDLNPGRPSGFVSEVGVVAGPGGFVYFTGDDGIHGAELWRTDGTPGGTVLVADLRPGPRGSYPRPLLHLDGQLLFAAQDTEHGRELWISDGTESGTKLFQDFRPGPNSSEPYGGSVIGDHVVVYAHDDQAGFEPWSFKRCRLPGADTLAPEGAITAPDAGACFGPNAVPVVVEDTFADRCDDEIVRTYVPEGGPSYAAHGDVALTLEAADSAGNTARDARSFTIDLVPPAVTLAPPPPLPRSLPASVPFSLVWTAGDDDGASGEVLREKVYLDDCLLWDGLTYGDGDGLLSGETLLLGRDELCTLALACGVVELRNPVVRVEAADCGGNVGSASATVNGAFRIPMAMCGL